MNKKSTSLYLSDKDIKKIEKLKEVYETENTSELVRILIQEEITRIQKYQNLNIN